MPDVRALRGATTIDVDDPEHIADRVEALLQAVFERNGISTDDLISILFSATADVRSCFPAAGARARIPALADVPLMNMAELDIVGALPRCIRVMVHAHTELPRAEVSHVFLEGATVLRPDLSNGVRR
jgi:chorismate mutase